MPHNRFFDPTPRPAYTPWQRFYRRCLYWLCAALLVAAACKWYFILFA